MNSSSRRRARLLMFFFPAVSRGTEEWGEKMSEAAVNIPVRLVYVRPVVAPLDFVYAAKLHLKVCLSVRVCESLQAFIYKLAHSRQRVQLFTSNRRFKVFFLTSCIKRLHAGRTKHVPNLEFFASLPLWLAPFWHVLSDFGTRVCDSCRPLSHYSNDS